ncbi:hypothetical protein [Echinimonas agarilytica]|uniref:Uncharacterized protein n=1 Tax=Echinimonas agarilytica TaxID=1215918 RepID=A0AA41W5D2_9GAMM|nr:hypothetical protein [Echinimonas agarilytica]MCM2679272.1 hypothetical protein [Echinimonas agarilytica]
MDRHCDVAVPARAGLELGLYPNQLSFTTSAAAIIHLIYGFWLEAAGTIP